ncbi:uncharacterized protein LOC109823043 isoform X2 [Asparagus officinalis]|uniref:uncharacterized protein LOC109823043 isoform X2 n=1 Tax=Asparagus officinalis TaxID=4686 RepID=UPI00098E1972|nr:uncharacterized protein LOC109823043 isoform X2 [Asparagus officinalis]
MADSRIKQQIVAIISSPDRSLAYSTLLHLHRSSADDPSSMESLSLSSPPLIPLLLSDINLHDEEIAALALKCLGFMLYHPSLVSIFSEEVAGSVLEALAMLIIETRMKAICNLGVWCISIHQLGKEVVRPRIDLLLRAVVHALDNPFGSLSTTFEAIQAVMKMAAQFCEKMRDSSNMWVPPIYRRLVSNDKKERDMAERCLAKTKSFICPPTLTLSKVIALDLEKRLLPTMLDMMHGFRQKLPLIQAWGWYICLLGSSSLKNRHLINGLLKIPEETFTEPDPQHQIASLVAWEQLIDAFLPSEKIDREMNYSDKANGLVRRIKVLVVPLKGIISSRRDISVHSSCLKTWHYLLHKLGISVNHPSVLMTSFWPILESGLSRGFGSMQSTSLWTSCLELLDDHILSKVRVGKHKLSAEKSLSHIFVNNKGTFKDYPIKWLPWDICNLDFYLKTISLVLRQGLIIAMTSENRKLAFSYSLRLFRSVLQGVEVELKMLSISYDRIQFCITTILIFLKELSEDIVSRYCDKQGKDFLLIAFQFMEASVELDSSIFASPLYHVSLDLKYISEIQISESAKSIAVECLKISSLVHKGMVCPIVYTTILDLCLMAQSIQNLLLSQTDDISCAVKHLKFLLFSKGPLLNLHAAVSFLYLHLGKPSSGIFCSLMMWRIIVRGFQETIDSASLSFLKFDSDGENCTVVYQLLCFPVVALLYSPEVSVYVSSSNSSDICLVSTEREIEMELTIEVWKLLFVSLSRCSQNRPLLRKNYSEGLSQMLISVLDKIVEIEKPCSSHSSVPNSQKIGFFLVFGELVICILKHAGILCVEASGLDSINQEDNSLNQGSPSNNCLGLVARFMMMAIQILKTNPHADHMIICRVFAALASFIDHICSKHDILLLMEMISEPLVQWLSWSAGCGEIQQISSIMYQLQCLCTKILDCLRRSQPSIIFNSRFLGIQASLLQMSLDHPHSSIADASIAFWNETYNQNVELNYPQCLLPILNKLSRIGRINLQPGCKLTTTNYSSAGKKVTGSSHKKISGADTMEGSYLTQGCVDIVAPGFRKKRLKITAHPSSSRGVKSVPGNDLGLSDYLEGRRKHRSADYLLEKLRKA